MKNMRIQVFAAIFVLLLLTACSRQQETAPFRLGLLVWPPYEIFYLAEQLGFYQNFGIEIVDYRTPSEAIRAYKNGSLDAVALTNHLFLRLYQDDPQQRIVYLIDESAGADVLLAKPEFTGIAELKGKRVGSESSTLGAYVLYRALESGGLSPEEISHVPIDMANQVEAFSNGRVDAMATYEPFRTQILQAGGVELFSSSTIPGEITDVLVSNIQVIAEKRPQLQRLIDGWQQALVAFRSNPLPSAAKISGREQLTPQEFIDALTGINLFGGAENRKQFTGKAPAYLGPLQKVAVRMQRMDLIVAPDDLAAALDTSFVESAGD